jgi:hypothetical protein
MLSGAAALDVGFSCLPLADVPLEALSGSRAANAECGWMRINIIAAVIQGRFALTRATTTITP